VTVENEMLRLGRILAADQGIEVECRGVVAMAAPGRIVIPSLERLDYLGPNAERMMHGYLDHEAAHALDSDFALIEKAAKEMPPGFKELLNTIEDGYIEARQGLRYRGARWNLERKNEWFWEHHGRQRHVDAATAPFWTRFSWALILCVRPYGGRTPENYRTLDPEVHTALCESQTEIAATMALATMPHATAQCWEIAETLWKRYEHKIEDLPPINTPEQQIAVELLSLLEGGRSEAGKGKRPYVVFNRDLDIETDLSGDRRASATYEAIYNEAALAADAFVFAFEAALAARRAGARSYGHDEGDFDHDLIARYAIGMESSDYLYSQQKTDIDDVRGVAVAVLVDCSGSMDGAPSRLAAQTAVAIHRACSTCEIPHEVCGFTTAISPDAGQGYLGDDTWMPSGLVARAVDQLKEARATGQDPRHFARIFLGRGPELDSDSPEIQVAHYKIFKSFGSVDGRGVGHIAGTANNLDGEAVLWQAGRLAARPERRRVMFVLSDGYPAGARREVDDYYYLHASIRRVIDAGIEVYGIGIMSDAVRKFYPTYWVAHKLTDLPQIAMGALIEVLGEQRTEHEWVTI